MYFRKKMLAVVVRWEREGQTRHDQRQFGTTQDEIGHLVAWLQHLQVAEVVMESTAQYWRPVWYGLEPHFRLHPGASLKGTRAARTEAGLSGCAADSRSVEQRGSGRELYTGSRAKAMALADALAGAVATHDRDHPQPYRRFAGGRRHQTDGSRHGPIGCQRLGDVAVAG